MTRRMFMPASSHMDREWYLPLDGNRVLFLKLFDRVFELADKYPGFKFYTDGQTSVLDDYLEARPDLREKAKKLVSEGRLIPGPWFVQSDERIPCGESLIRNLLIGRARCAELGGSMKCGYVPDSFGHISQLPQLFNQFGIDTAFMMRGPDREKTGRDFIWDGKKHSSLVCCSTEYGKSSVCDWEGRLWNGIRTAETAEELEDCLKFARDEKYAAAPCDIFIMGGDGQTLPDNPEFACLTRSDTLDDVFEFLRRYKAGFKHVSGELNQSGDIKTLQDTLASRIYLKTLNCAVQTELARFAEALVLISSPNDLSRAGMLRLAWKTLVENHTHDGITGCHCNRTADDIENRLTRVSSMARGLSDLALEELAEQTDTSFAGENALCVFHPSAKEGPAVVPFKVRVRSDTAAESIRIFDDAGNEAPIMIHSRRETGTIRSNNRAQQMFRKVTVFEGSAYFDSLPAMGMKAFEVKASASAPVYSFLTATENRVSTPFIDLEITGSSLRLTDKRTGRVYENLNAMWTQCSAGDCYTIVPQGEKRRIECKGRPAYCNGTFAGFEFAGEDIKWTCEVNAFDPVVRINLTIANASDDRAVYASFETGGGTPFRDQPFALEKGACGIQPSSSFAGFEKDGAGLTLMHKGIHRAEFGEDGTLTLTLLSCQGRLYSAFFPDSRNDDFDGCQVHRTVVHSYALLPTAGGEDLFSAAQEFIDGVMCFDALPHSGEKGSAWSYMSITNAVQTCMKKSEDGKRVLVRLFNPAYKQVIARLRLPEGAHNPVKLSADERIMCPIDPNAFALEEGEIASIGFEV